jgi:hypothetical protein
MSSGYRSAQGKMVDMSVLAKQNEQVRAVGNMGVNARGDLVDSNNRVIQNRNASVASEYGKTVNNAVAKPFKAPQAPRPLDPDLSKEEQQMFEELDQEEEAIKETKKK